MFGLVGFVVWVWGVDRLVVVCFGFWWLVYCYGINFRVLFRLVDLFGWVDCVFFWGVCWRLLLWCLCLIVYLLVVVV